MITRAKFGNLMLNVSIVTLGMLLGAHLYNLLVDVPNWGGDIPESLQRTRDYWQIADPRNFFNVVSPLTYLALLMALVGGWNRPRSRKTWIIAALVSSVCVTVLSLAYFYPRNDLLFFNLFDPANAELLRATLREWVLMHWVRMALSLLAVTCALRALNLPLEADS